MNTNKKYNVIGDIHGRTCWKELVKDDCVNIFVGDYFDPYGYLPFEQLAKNFEEIIDYKMNHPETVLLYGNHDLHYLTPRDRGTRYNGARAEEIKELFENNQNLFNGVAYAVDNVLVTHAGVTKEWYEKEFGAYNGEEPKVVAEGINDLWKHNKIEFTFLINKTMPYDVSGDSPTHSPMWVRIWTLAEHNLFAGTKYKQVFGHTQVDNIIEVDDSLYCVDCLGTIVKSYMFTI